MTRLPNGQADGVVMRRAPRERSRFLPPVRYQESGTVRGCRAAVAMAGQRKASFSAAALSARLQAPRCGSAADGASAGGLPRALVFRRPREGLLGLCTRSFLKVPRTTSAGKPDANFLLEIKHGLNDAQQKFHAEWRGEGTIRPPINGKAQGLVRPGLL